MISLKENRTFVVLVCIVLIYWYVRIRRRKFATNRFRQCAEYINHDKYDSNVQEMTTLFDRIKNPSALDFYYMGAAYSHNLKNPEKAQHFYNRAVKAVHAGDDTHAAFIEGKIQDEVVRVREETKHNRNTHHRDQDEGLLQAIANSLRDALPSAMTVEPDWTVDNQNVHDRAVVDQLKRDYLYLKFKHGMESVYDMGETGHRAVEFMKNKVSGKSKKALNRIKDNAMLVPLTDEESGTRIGERDLLGLVVAHAQHLNNPAVFDVLIENMEDCVDGSGSLVCSGGRAARLMSTFAHMDPERPDLGKFASIQVMKNEMLSATSVIRDSVISTPEDEADYVADNERGKELTADILAQAMEKIRKDYPTMFQDELISHVQAAI